MPFTHYRRMTTREAAAALEAFHADWNRFGELFGMRTGSFQLKTREGWRFRRAEAGGGAFLEVLEGKTLPAFQILQQRAAG